MAMNEKLCRPLDFTVIESTAGTAAGPVNNLKTDRLGRAWQVAATGGYVVIDLGAAIDIDLVAVLATNLGALADWQLRGATTAAALAGATPPGPFVYNLYKDFRTSPEMAKRVHQQGIFMLDPAVSARYWRIDIVGAPNPFHIGRLVIGKSFTAADTMDIGYSFRVVDNGENRRASNGLEDPVTRGKVLQYNWTWSWMSEQEARGALLDLLAYAGTTRDILCVLNPDAADLHNVIGYGKLVEEVEGINVGGGVGTAFNAYEAKFSLRSRLILNL